MVGTKETKDVKNSIGNGEAKELICMTHGHEKRRGVIAEGKGRTRWRGQKGKNWDNCNSIITKKYYKKEFHFLQVLFSNFLVEPY